MEASQQGHPAVLGKSGSPLTALNSINKKNLRTDSNASLRAANQSLKGKTLGRQAVQLTAAQRKRREESMLGGSATWWGGEILKRVRGSSEHLEI